MDGHKNKDAYETLKTMRTATYEGVGSWRIDLAEKLILPGLID
jgi:imidazolonepropionase-like amidohydrolase